MRLQYAMTVSLLASLAGCGDDPPPAPPPKAGAAKPGAPKPGKAPPQFAVRVRIEDRVLDPDEKKAIRHVFKERDFIVDQNNRDPFQSFVLNQGIVGPASEVKPMDVTKKCTRPEQLVATNYSYTDLRLVGIVAQGTQRKVLMMDAGNLGHIIKRGDCVGREKAVVTDIGTGYVTFQVEPDQNNTGVVKPPEERSVQLYPNQMPVMSQPNLDTGAATSTTPDVAPPTSPRPPTVPEKSPNPN
ncbi:MAG: hypothetical protein H0T46_06620 [Deltaproteobacteria bacterium]|nr:hypothetical protein [Deltaproteobacteria bacterium]